MKIRKIQRLVSVIGFAAAVLVIACLKNDLPINALIIETHFDKNDPWQLFYDLGAGYQESASRGRKLAITTKVGIAGKIRERRFALPLQKINSLRIAPGNREGDLTLSSITLVHRYPWLQYRETLYTWDAAQIVKDFQPLQMIDRFTAANGVVQIHATGKDPQFGSVGDFSQVYAHVNRPALPLNKLLLYLLAFVLAGLLFFADAVFDVIKRVRRTHVLRLFWSAGMLVVGFGLGRLIWEKIALPFHNPLEVVGPLTLAHFSPNTNALRYLLFVSLPTVLLLLGLAFPYFRRIFLQDPPAPQSAYADGTNEYQSLWGRKILVWCSWLIFFVIALGDFFAFFFADFHPRQLDFFHDGELLTPAYNYLATGQLWQGSYFAHGVLYDPLSAYLGWKLFGQNTIGAADVAVYGLILLIPAALVILCLSLAGAVAKEDWTGKILLPQLCLLLYWLSSNFLEYQFLDRRDVPVILGLACIVAAFSYQKPAFFCLAGLFSALAYFYSIDRGAYFSALLVMLLILMPFFRFTPERLLQRKCWGALLGGILVGWLVFIGVFGITECRHFLANTLLLYKTKDLIDSFIYPTPTDLLSIHTVPMLMIGVQVFFFALCFLRNYWRNLHSRRWGYVHLSFLLLAIFYFRSAIGLSNVWHVWYAATFAFLGLVFLLWELVRKLNHAALRFLVVAVLLVVNLIGIFLDLPFSRQTQLTNLFSFQSRLAAYVRLDDDAFLIKEDQAGIHRMQAIFDKEPCVFVYTSEAALPYLLKKPSCDKNFIIWFCSPQPKQTEIIRDLTATAPKYLVFMSKALTNNTNGIWNDQRVPAVHKFILDRYEPYETVQDNWQIYQLKPAYGQK